MICIGGPTASGKTRLAIELALIFGTEIVSFDSRQIYKEMEIGVARPTSAELAAVKHHLIASYSITEEVSAGKFADTSRALIKNIFADRDFVIAVGGNGFYLQKLLYPMDEIPAVTKEVKMYVESQEKESGMQWLQDYVRENDPKQFQAMDQQNPARLRRVAEVMAQTGKPFSSYLGKTRTVDLPVDRVLYFALMPERQRLYGRINNRVDVMIREGLVDEVKSLMQYKDLKAMNTVGYSEIFQYLEGSISLDRAIELIKQNSRNYAKRQYTWFRNQNDWFPIHADNIDQQIEIIKSKL